MKIILTSLILETYDYSKKSLVINNNNSMDEGSYPLGLPYIHSYLLSKGHKVSHLNFMYTEFERSKDILISEIETFKPNAIGFSMLTDNRANTYKMIEYIHKNYPDIKIVVGGIHATIMYEQIIKTFPYVIVIIGEGEITFGELMEGKPWQSIDGIAFCDGDKVVKTNNRELCDLDMLPFPIHPVNEKRTLVNLMSSRGCPYSCSFCVLNPNTRRIQRLRSAKNAVDEIENIINKYHNIKTVYFMDDAFLTNTQRAVEICEEIIRRGLNRVEYQCQSRIKPFHKELVSYLEKANFNLIAFGLETANEKMLRACHKSITQQDVINTLTILKDSSIQINLFLLVGLPGESQETINETIKFVKRLQKIKYFMHYDVNPGILLVFPGTEIYEMVKKAGKIADKYWLTDKPTPVFTLEHSVDELIKFRNEISDQTAFMPLSLKKVYYQRNMLFQIFKYVVNKYRTNPLMLIKNGLKNKVKYNVNQG